MSKLPDEVHEKVSSLAKPFEKLERLGKDGLVYAYHDPVGYPTIGYGHLLSRKRYEDLKRFKPIEREVAEALLQKDIEKAGLAVSRLLKTEVDVNQFSALTDFAFNVGAGNLQISTLLKKVNRRDFEGAALEFPKWIYSNGIKLRGLLRRRLAEQKMFLGETSDKG